MRKVVALSSMRNHSWASMQEIVPHLVDQWLDCSGEEVEVFHFDLEKDNFKQVLSTCFNADVVVLTIFTLPLLQFVKSLRQQFDLQFRLVFHLHGFATFGCWPLYYWKLGELLTLDDVFVASCWADYDAFKGFFPDARCQVIPFSLPRPTHQVNCFTDTIPILYVGRLSEQKHLELSLLAIKKVVERGHSIHFHIYGEEDHLGSPHMGRRQQSGYADFLHSLCEKLEITQHVTFHGFVQRDKIDREWHKNASVFLSPSLHSDENFGMSVFRYLLRGSCAVISKWGGHIDLVNNFYKALGVDVRGSSAGPWISVHDLADALEHSFTILDNDSQIPVRYYEINQKYRDIIELPRRSGKLDTPSIIPELLQRLERYRADEHFDESCQIFSGYGDLLALRFFHYYGMIY